MIFGCFFHEFWLFSWVLVVFHWFWVFFMGFGCFSWVLLFSLVLKEEEEQDWGLDLPACFALALQYLVICISFILVFVFVYTLYFQGYSQGRGGAGLRLRSTCLLRTSSPKRCIDHCKLQPIHCHHHHQYHPKHDVLVFSFFWYPGFWQKCHSFFMRKPSKISTISCNGKNAYFFRPNFILRFRY